MAINNRQKIYQLHYFIRRNMGSNTSDLFYNIQILTRKKDGKGNEGKTKKTKLIKSINLGLYNFEENLEAVWDSIIKICENENARAMINLQPKDYQVVNLKTIGKISQNLIGLNPKHLVENTKGFMQSVIDDSTWSALSYVRGKVWVVDFDKLEGESEDDFNKRVDKVSNFIHYKIGQEKMKDGEMCIDIIPSKNGVHQITRPFDVKYFTDNYEKETGYPISTKPEIQKHGLTNLYIPD